LPPEAMTLRSSNCRNIFGIMMGWPHLEQGTVPNGGRSPGMKTFVSHCPQVTIFNMSLALITFGIYHAARPPQATKKIECRRAVGRSPRFWHLDFDASF
jgi:hypothetical protein